MRKIVQQSQFKSDLKKIARSGRYQVSDLIQIVEKLANGRALKPKHHDHNLSGNWIDFRECHIKPDWLLIYRLEPDLLTLVRTGSHSELF